MVEVDRFFPCPGDAKAIAPAPDADMGNAPQLGPGQRPACRATHLGRSTAVGRPVTQSHWPVARGTNVRQGGWVTSGDPDDDDYEDGEEHQHRRRDHAADAGAGVLRLSIRVLVMGWASFRLPCVCGHILRGQAGG